MPLNPCNCAPLFLLVFLCRDAPGQVHFDVKTDRVSIDIDRAPFSTLFYGTHEHKPFLWPLRTASGKIVTRGFPVQPLPGDPTDHPHQRGLWIGVEHLSGMDFWENDPSYTRPRMGRIQFQDLTSIAEGQDKGVLSFIADWIGPDGAHAIRETRRMVFYARHSAYRMFDIELSLRADETVTFEDHHDALLGIRLSPEFAEEHGGVAVNAAGARGEAGVRGQRSPFLDWSTRLNGEEVGVAIFDHPKNRNYPTRWHVRSMGFMTASPFAGRDFDSSTPDASYTLHRGETIKFLYRVLIHPPGTDLQMMSTMFAKEDGGEK